MDSKSPKPRLIKVLHWNILSLFLGNQSAFPLTPMSYLDPVTRLPKILDQLREMRPDLLCLCEVDAEVVPELAKLGYKETRFMKKPDSNNKDGLCLIYNTFEGFSAAVYSQHLFKNEETGENMNQGFLQLVLKDAERKKCFCIMTTHLKASKDCGAIREVQLKQLAQKLMAEKEKAEKDQFEFSFLVTGDFNSIYKEEDNMRKFVENIQGEFVNDPLVNTSYKYHKAEVLEEKCIDYIIKSKNLETPKYKLLSVEIDTKVALPNKKMPSDHLPLYVEVLLP